MAVSDGIRFQCPHCSKGLRVAAKLASRRVNCPNPVCGKLIDVPSPLDDKPVARAASRPGSAPKRRSPARRAESSTALPAPQVRRSRWPWYAGGGIAALCVVLGAVLIVAISGKYWTNTAHGLTPEQLLGEWEGKFEGGSVKFTFYPDQKPVAGVVLKFGGSVTVGAVGYEIDGKTNEVKFPFLTKAAVAKPTKDGALLFSGGQFTFGSNTYTVPETRIERIKPDAGAKNPPALPAGASPSGNIDDSPLAKDGPGDPALTYHAVYKNTAKYRGKRVTWVLVPCSAEGKRMMCALDQREAMSPEHKGIYVVEFESVRDATDAFLAAAARPGAGQVTATVVGDIDQFLVIKSSNGTAPKDIPKVTVPLLRYPALPIAATKDSGGDPGQIGPVKPKTEPKAEPKTAPEPPKVETISKASLLGDWKGKLANGTVQIKLTDKHAVVALFYDGGSFAVGSVGWTIDAKSNEIRVDEAKAILKKDGSLSIAGRIRITNFEHHLPETRLERQPAGKPDPKKGDQPKSKTPQASKLPGAAGDRVDYPRRPPMLWAVFLATPDKLPKGGPTAPFSQVLPSGTKKVTVGVVFHQEPLAAAVTVKLISDSGDVKLANAKQDWLKINATYIRYVDLIAAAGPFRDGPYQAEVSINGKVVAYLNWTVGKAPTTVPLRLGAAGPSVDLVQKPPEALQVQRFFFTDDPKKIPGPKDSVPQIFASGTKEIWVGMVLKQKPPDGTNLAVFVLDDQGIIKMPGDFKDIRMSMADEFIWLMPCSPDKGAFADGPHQAQVYLDGVRYAFLNWSLGEQVDKKGSR